MVAPVGPWPTEAQLASFAADSYLLLPRWLTPGMVGTLQAELEVGFATQCSLAHSLSLAFAFTH